MKGGTFGDQNRDGGPFFELSIAYIDLAVDDARSHDFHMQILPEPSANSVSVASFAAGIMKPRSRATVATPCPSNSSRTISSIDMRHRPVVPASHQRQRDQRSDARHQHVLLRVPHVALRPEKRLGGRS